MSKKQWGLEFNSYPRNIQWALDIDYVDKLNEEQRFFLNTFLQEYYRDCFDADAIPLHDTPALKKSCSDKKNARNRCAMSIQGEKLLYLENEESGEI